MIIIPKEMMKHPENQAEIMNILEEFFERDLATKEDEKKLLEKVKEVLKDEPTIFDNFVREEIEN